METEIAIVDRGRGPQLSTSRITVQDLLPYFQMGYSDERIICEAMPSLSPAEIRIARRYVEEHRDEVMEEDRLIREWNAGRKNSPKVEEVLRQGREERLAWLASRKHRHAEDAASEGRAR